ncbi:glycosyltransferase [Pseudomonas sp. p99-361]|uniref:Glycosyltransferase n=1 Tax=Pseudomonas juntendi TaxID=2666183 RepID=A0A7W2QVH2_9PSED|nr:MULTISPECIES: glycosyltransferase [Pseudomonas]MBA6144342.1 glycosyltransferase [Pseudomonas juntendi]QEQ87078.1 glycosyltransferase [Pseudomonas putida]RRV18428.1 glycosyltransferase [Pseudomonas sp. p99-361]
MSVKEGLPSVDEQAGSQVKKNAVTAPQKKGGSARFVLDLVYYRGRYPDLSSMTDEALEQHWHTFGYQEGRYASASHENGDAKLVAEAVLHAAESAVVAESDVPTVELDFYLTFYPDLRAGGVDTQAIAEMHFQRYGRAEGRLPSVKEWAKKHGVPEQLIPSGFSLSAVIERSAKRGLELEPQRIMGIFLGQDVIPVDLADTPQKSQAVFSKLGAHYLSSHKAQQGRILLEAALSLGPCADACGRLGGSYMDDGHFNIALQYFDAAAQLPNPPVWTAFNRAHCLAKLHRLDEAIQVLADGIAVNPNHRPQQDELERLAEQKWRDVHAKLMTRVDTLDRERLIRDAYSYATKVYRAFLPVFGGLSQGPAEALPALPPLGDLNTDRILIVGDFHVAQCIRYRIEQKIEQLEAVGKHVTAINWTELDKHKNALALHDVVIFYRVPAVMQVIRAIAQVNATGKLSLYEIDDLLFVPEYPPSIESYGGYVSLATHRELTRGMALFNAAARLCRQGIASTEPLRLELAKLVRENKCWLHRNGLDSLNRIRSSDKSHKKTIDIFYGSGTQAHNTDFIEQALPAIQRVLSEIPQARLVVVGYLRLPAAFTTQYTKQFTQLPAMDSVQGYWSLLEQADINIAVLHDDKVNACKSELKWFEAGCFGIPSVLSSTANYRDVVKDGEDGFLATTVEEWYSALKKLAGSQTLREKVGQAAQRRAESDYSLHALGSTLAATLDGVASAIQQAKPKKKIALVNVFFPPQAIGGATRVVADNFSEFRKSYADDFDVCVFTADVECRPPHEMTVYSYEGCRVYRSTTLWREHMDWHPKDPEMYRLFQEFLELEKPDLIHFHCVQRLTASIVEAARDAGIPYVVTIHDAWWISDFQFLVDHNSKVYPDGHLDPFQPIELPTNMKLADSIERRRDLKELLHNASRVFTVSNAFAQIYRQNGIPQIEVIANGVSSEIMWSQKDTSHTERVVCGHIGGMAEHKGYYLLKEAVLQSQPENVELLIVDHSKEEGYEYQTLWGAVPVTFIGRVSQKGIVDLYRKIDVLFAPSMWPESFGLVTREAVASGCWVVASNMGGIGEDIVQGRNGYVIEPTQKMLVDALQHISALAGKHKAASTTEVRRTSASQADELRQIYLSFGGKLASPEGVNE